MRCLVGTDPKIVANRVAFIEKTPRVRIAPWAGSLMEDGRNWRSGPKGVGGAGGEDPKEQLYGHYPPSREWCDAELRAMGYTLG